MIVTRTPEVAARRHGAADSAAIARLVAEHADQAVLTEVLVTPKPGLVDRRNSGAHRDMDLQTFFASARAVAPWWGRFMEIGCTSALLPARDVLPMLRHDGLACERAMLQATRGVNTHKGAIFSLGLLCAAAGRLAARGAELDRTSICLEVAGFCDGLVERELGGEKAAHTAGERIFREHGLPGARGEAASGYALVRAVALPVYDALRLRGVDENLALLQVLLHLLALNGDTNVVSRGGIQGLEFVHRWARKLLREGGVLVEDGLARMVAFDDALIERHLSPGGSADLLAVTWFLARFPAAREDGRAA